jgi:3-methyladenine DNA glycosylase AlkD
MKKDFLNNCLIEVKNKVDTTAKNSSSQRILFKQKFSFSERSKSEQLIIWDYIWNKSSDFWICVQSFLFLEMNMKDKCFLADSWETIKKWQKKVDNWGKCDALSKIYTKVLEIIPEKVLEQLKQWNKSKKLWDKRQSLVSLLYFSRTKSIILPYETIIPFVIELIDDKEYYVQKGVGWTLKELYCVYPNKTLKYIEKNATRISAIAFSAAIEKLDKADKERLKKLRKQSRQQKT